MIYTVLKEYSIFWFSYGARGITIINEVLRQDIKKPSGFDCTTPFGADFGLFCLNYLAPDVAIALLMEDLHLDTEAEAYLKLKESFEAGMALYEQ